MTMSLDRHITNSKETTLENKLMNLSPSLQGLDITHLLKLQSSGEPEALNELIPHVYAELRRMAQYHLRGYAQTLQPTALVHEVYLHLFDGEQIEWQNREHFFSIAGKQMRWLVVDYVRRKTAQKRGRDFAQVTFDGLAIPDFAQPDTIDLIALDRALHELEAVYPRVAQVVELRYFVGLTEQQIAEIVEISERQVRRDWAFAKAWLHDKLK